MFKINFAIALVVFFSTRAFVLLAKTTEVKKNKVQAALVKSNKLVESSNQSSKENNSTTVPTSLILKKDWSHIKGKELKNSSIRGQILVLSDTFIIIEVLKIGSDILDYKIPKRPLKIKVSKFQAKVGDLIDFIPQQALSRQNDFWLGKIISP